MSDEADQISAIYDKYPRKVGKIAALKAIQKAVAYLVKEEQITPIDARRKLYKATLLYAWSPAGQNPDRTLVPHPATWYNRGSYLDDPKEWQHGGFNNAALPTGKADRNLAVLAESLGRGERENRSNEDGLFPAGNDRQDNARILHAGSEGS